jgi:hypothetical protein
MVLRNGKGSYEYRKTRAIRPSVLPQVAPKRSIEGNLRQLIEHQMWLVVDTASTASYISLDEIQTHRRSLLVGILVSATFDFQPEEGRTALWRRGSISFFLTLSL